MPQHVLLVDRVRDRVRLHRWNLHGQTRQRRRLPKHGPVHFWELRGRLLLRHRMHRLLRELRRRQHDVGTEWKVRFHQGGDQPPKRVRPRRDRLRFGRPLRRSRCLPRLHLQGDELRRRSLQWRLSGRANLRRRGTLPSVRIRELLPVWLRHRHRPHDVLGVNLIPLPVRGPAWHLHGQTRQRRSLLGDRSVHFRKLRGRLLLRWPLHLQVPKLHGGQHGLGAKRQVRRC